MNPVLLFETVQVEMNSEDARLFHAFQEHYDNIVKLLNAKAFEVRNGTVVLHLDGASNIKRIDRHDALFLDQSGKP